MTNPLHHLGGGIAQPDPVAAAHHPSSPGRILPAHLGARFGAALLFRARNRRPGKFFGRECHLSVLASTPCAHHQMSTGVVRRDGNIFHETGN